MAKVGIVMGSDSDLDVMSKAAEILEEFGIDYEMTVISAHRMPDVFYDYATHAEERGIKVIIAGAGGAAHLPGMAAAIFQLPVVGVPIHTKSLDDELLKKLKDYKQGLKDKVSAKAAKLEEIGYKEYLKQM